MQLYILEIFRNIRHSEKFPFCMHIVVRISFQIVLNSIKYVVTYYLMFVV
jgi:hypothetical protein